MAIGQRLRNPPFALSGASGLSLSAQAGGAAVELAQKFKILVVEDDALIAMELGERLDEMGYAVLGPAQNLADAEALAAGETPHAALLDAKLGDETSVGLGAALAARGVPIAFCTGYDEVKNLPPELKSAPVLTKPISDVKLAAALKQMLGIA